MTLTPAEIDRLKRDAESSPTALLLTLCMAAERGDLIGAAAAQRALRDQHGIDVRWPLAAHRRGRERPNVR